MIELILLILGYKAQNIQRLGGFGLGLGRPGALVWAIPLAIALSLGAVYSYRRIAREFPGTRPILLSSLRIALFLLLLLLFLRPTLGFNVESVARKSLVLLIDASASMRIEDVRISPDDKKRSAIALGRLDPTLGLKQELPRDASGLNVSRIKLIRSALADNQVNLLSRLQKEFDLRVVTFGQRNASVDTSADASKPSAAKPNAAKPNAWIDSLDAVAPLTATGDAIREVIAGSRGQQLGGIIVVTDGVINSGLPGSSAAVLAKQEGVPLFPWGVGVSDVRDINVADLFTPEVAFKDDTVRVTVRVRNRGLGGESATLKLKLGDELAAQQPIELDRAGEQSVVLQFAPRKKGDFTLSASIDPRDDEAVKDNNTASQHLRVVDGKLKVLYVEQSPRWEFHYLQAQLARDRRVEAKFFVVEADPAIAGRDTPYLSRFPTTREDLFQYDLIIVGDVPPSALGPEGPAWLEEYVSKLSGGVLMIAGHRNAPSAFFDTPIGKLLPIEKGSSDRRGLAAEPADDKPIIPELTVDGKQNPLMRLAEDPATSQKMWAARRPLYWAYGASRAKPATEVLMQFADAKIGGRGARSPLIAIQQYGAGTVAFVGTDNTWRWRAEGGEPVYTAFWGQMVQRLALPHFLGVSPRIRLSTERRDYSVFDKVAVLARLYDQTFKPLNEPTVPATCQSASGVKSAVVLRAVNDQPGMYRAEFQASELGQYQFWVDRDPQTTLDISVSESKLEFAETAMSKGTLEQMASISAGSFVREEDLSRLPELIQSKNEWVKTRVDIELALTPPYFVLLVLVASAEWYLRKKVELK